MNELLSSNPLIPNILITVYSKNKIIIWKQIIQLLRMTD